MQATTIVLLILISFSLIGRNDGMYIKGLQRSFNPYELRRPSYEGVQKKAYIIVPLSWLIRAGLRQGSGNDWKGSELQDTDVAGDVEELDHQSKLEQLINGNMVPEYSESKGSVDSVTEHVNYDATTGHGDNNVGDYGKNVLNYGMESEERSKGGELDEQVPDNGIAPEQVPDYRMELEERSKGDNEVDQVPDYGMQMEEMSKDENHVEQQPIDGTEVAEKNIVQPRPKLTFETAEPRSRIPALPMLLRDSFTQLQIGDTRRPGAFVQAQLANPQTIKLFETIGLLI